MSNNNKSDSYAQKMELYSALLRYAPESGSLRQRATDRIVLAALLEGTEQAPVKVSRVTAATSIGPGFAALRLEVVNEALARFVKDGLCTQAEPRKDNKYFLTTAGREHLSQLRASGDNLLERVINQLLKDLEHTVDYQVGVSVCRAFICECFSRYGSQLARDISGKNEGIEIDGAIDAREAFLNAIAKRKLSEAAKSSLHARCSDFLKSRDPDYQQLRFRLVQTYYVAQLLDVGNAAFDPIAKDAFKDAVLYLDTNILIPCLLRQNVVRQLDEVLTLAKRLGIVLRVTRATLEEIKRVAADRFASLQQLASVPDDVLARASDDILHSFVEERRTNPGLTPVAFMDRFSDAPRFFTELGIELFDTNEDEILNGRTLLRESTAIARIGQEKRGSPKRNSVLKHDLAHYALTTDDRAVNAKTWFLTQDACLCTAAFHLAAGGSPFCLSITGFLQSISPFLESSSSSDSLAEVFSLFMEHEILGLDLAPLYDTAEIALIAELHSDVLATHPAQILRALDHVKRSVLRGQPYRLEDHAAVALGIKKYLSHSEGIKRGELEAELRRQRDTTEEASRLADNERQARQLVEASARDLDEELQASKRSRKEQDATIRALRDENRRNAVFRTRLVRLGACGAGLAAWHLAQKCSSAVSPTLLLILVGISLLVFVWGADGVLALSIRNQAIRMGLTTMVTTAAIVVSGVVNEQTVSFWGSALTLATVVALVVASSRVPSMKMEPEEGA